MHKIFMYIIIKNLEYPSITFVIKHARRIEINVLERLYSVFLIECMAGGRLHNGINHHAYKCLRIGGGERKGLKREGERRSFAAVSARRRIARRTRCIDLKAT